MFPSAVNCRHQVSRAGLTDQPEIRSLCNTMRFVLTNFGTLGDFRPLLILAKELAARGHHPVLAFPRFVESLAVSTKFEFCPVGPNLSFQRNCINLQWTSSPDLYESAEQMFALLQPLQEAFPSMLDGLKRACIGADILISGPTMPVARMVHEITGIPFVSVQLGHFGGTGGPALRRAGQQLVNPFRVGLGLPELVDPLTRGANSPQLALYAISQHLRPRPEEWPPHWRITGFFFDHLNPIWHPDPDLERFIGEGSAPVVITMGSMVHQDEESLAELFVQAIELAQCRAILQGLKPVSSGKKMSTVYCADFISHEWLFPQAACVVFHGGAGTGANVFRSGTPGIFIPHNDCYDQRYWAQLAFEAGCAVPPIPYSRLTPAALASAITETVQREDLRLASAVLSAKIRKEKGAALAAEWIEVLAMQLGLCSGSAFEEPPKENRRIRVSRRAFRSPEWIQS